MQPAAATTAPAYQAHGSMNCQSAVTMSLLPGPLGGRNATRTSAAPGQSTTATGAGRARAAESALPCPRRQERARMPLNQVHPPLRL